MHVGAEKQRTTLTKLALAPWRPGNAVARLRRGRTVRRVGLRKRTRRRRPPPSPSGRRTPRSSARPIGRRSCCSRIRSARAPAPRSASWLKRSPARTSLPKTYVVFLKPSSMPDGWEQTDLWKTAAALPNATVVRDDDGREAERFGAATSGQTMLYDARGSLLFSGGITGARAHAGDNAGRSAIVALLNVDPAPTRPPPTCSDVRCSHRQSHRPHADPDAARTVRIHRAPHRASCSRRISTTFTAAPIGCSPA